VARDANVICELKQGMRYEDSLICGNLKKVVAV